jgi:hypothetical protein
VSRPRAAILGSCVGNPVDFDSLSPPARLPGCRSIPWEIFALVCGRGYRGEKVESIGIGIIGIGFGVGGSSRR